MSMATTMLVIKPVSPLIHQPRKARLNHRTTHAPLSRVLSHPTTCLASVATPAAQSLVDEFDPELPIEEAWTPPSSWYTDPSFLDLELERVFYRGWQAVGYSDQVKSPQDFFTGRLGNVEFVVCRGDNGKIHAFHNVCRHHASLLASGSGRKSCFVCPYHGWTYALNGALLRATRIKGIRNFDVKEFGLVPLKVATWGPFVLLNFERDVSPAQEVESDRAAKEWTGSCVDILGNNCIESSLTYLCRREYTIECNWKVFCDNYLDGGYHVPYAHKGLASGLKLDSYSTTIHEKVSLQICEGGSADSADDFDRLGAKAVREARGKAFSDMYKKLGSKEGKKIYIYIYIYRLARTMGKKSKDLTQIRCIKDENQKLLVKDEEVKERWVSYFNKLYNGEGDRGEVDLVDALDELNRTCG